jgi:hypothetical protein
MKIESKIAGVNIRRVERDSSRSQVNTVDLSVPDCGSSLDGKQMLCQQSWLRPSCANVLNFNGFASQQRQSESASENLTATLAERAIDPDHF